MQKDLTLKEGLNIQLRLARLFFILPCLLIFLSSTVYLFWKQIRIYCAEGDVWDQEGMKQELNRKQMEKNSTEIFHNMVYLRRGKPSGEFNFPRRSQKKEYLNHWWKNLFHFKWGPLILLCVVNNIPDWVTQDDGKL